MLLFISVKGTIGIKSAMVVTRFVSELMTKNCFEFGLHFFGNVVLIKVYTTVQFVCTMVRSVCTMVIIGCFMLPISLKYGFIEQITLYDKIKSKMNKEKREERFE